VENASEFLSYLVLVVGLYVMIGVGSMQYFMVVIPPLKDVVSGMGIWGKIAVVLLWPKYIVISIVARRAGKRAMRGVGSSNANIENKNVKVLHVSHTTDGGKLRVLVAGDPTGTLQDIADEITTQINNESIEYGKSVDEWGLDRFRMLFQIAANDALAELKRKMMEGGEVQQADGESEESQNAEG
jgi:hypothetical protein